LDVLSYFFENSDIELGKYVNFVMHNLIPLLTYENENNKDTMNLIFDKIECILKNVVNQIDKNILKDYIEYLLDELVKNNERLVLHHEKDKDTQMVMVGLNHRGILQQILKFIEISLVCGSESTCYLA